MQVGAFDSPGWLATMLSPPFLLVQEMKQFPWKPLEARQQVAGGARAGHVARRINQAGCKNQVSKG